MGAIERLNLFEELYVKDSSNYDVDFLAKLLNKQKVEIVSALSISPATAKRNGIAADNQMMKQWMTIFNLVVDLIEEADLDLNKSEIHTHMGRYLRLPNSHFNNASILETMMAGKARKAIKFLEQIAR